MATVFDLLFKLVLIWSFLLLQSNGSAHENISPSVDQYIFSTANNMLGQNHPAWSVGWWDSKTNTSTNPNNELIFQRGVSLNIVEPADGQVVRYVAGWGDITPIVNVQLGDGELADLIRSNVSAWYICLSIDTDLHSCTPLVGAATTPRLDVDTRRGVHVLRAWLGSSVMGRGEQDPKLSVASRFSTHPSMLGTGCRSIANWFLIASNKGIGNRLMRRLYTDMKNTWLELLEKDNIKAGSGISVWRYFEMDCILSEIRLKNQIYDEAIMELQAFPVGNFGDPDTPQECLGLSVEFDEHSLQPVHTSWMLKLKGELPNIDEYKTYLDHRLTSQPSPHPVTTQEEDGIPRVIWMFWYLSCPYPLYTLIQGSYARCVNTGFRKRVTKACSPATELASKAGGA